MAKSKTTGPKTETNSPRRRKVTPSNFTVFAEKPMEGKVALLEVSSGHKDTAAARKWVADNAGKYGVETRFRVGNMGPPIQLKVETVVKARIVDAGEAPAEAPSGDD